MYTFLFNNAQRILPYKPLTLFYNLQVHKAVLKDGREVAVKVQHKAVKQHAFQDAKVIEVFI